MVDKLFDFIFKHFTILVLLGVIVAIVLTLWAYDGDVKCLVAECRRIKK